ncbi:MAG TPA: aminopeptidase, partial [Candidatus Methylomirabilis sp.]
MPLRSLLLVPFLLLLCPAVVLGQGSQYDTDKFRQLEEILPTPNGFRTASGAPGPQYWQQQADYVIHVTLDDAKQRISGSETVHYVNHSPETLRYIWLQLDNNIFDPRSAGALSSSAPGFKDRKGKATLPYRTLARMVKQQDFDGSLHLTRVEDASGAPLEHTVVGTVMRIELPEPLASGDAFDFACDWNYAINDAFLIGGRTGYEYFEKDKNYIYEIAHWYPRLVSYTDVH